MREGDGEWRTLFTANLGSGYNKKRKKTHFKFKTCRKKERRKKERHFVECLPWMLRRGPIFRHTISTKTELLTGVRYSHFPEVLSECSPPCKVEGERQ